MAHIKDILDYCEDAATANSYDYLIASSLAEVNKASSRKYPLIMLIPPSTVDNPRGYGSHSFTVFVLNRLKNTTGDTLAHSNDKLHGAYKVLEDAFYAWLASLEALGGGGIVQVPFDSDVEISRLRDRQLQDELVGIQVQLTIYTTWYCGTDNPNLIPCDDATILNADGSQYLTVASGSSVQLTGVEVTGNTSASGTYNDGSTFTVSGVEVTGNTPISGTFNDGSTVSVSGFELTGRTAASGTFNDGSSYEVSGVNIQGETPLDGTDVFDGGVVNISGVTIAGNTPDTGIQQDGSTFTVSGVEVTGNTPISGTFNDGSVVSVSGVEVTGATSASGTYNDGSVFTVSGCTVNDDGNTFTLQDGETYNVFRNDNSVVLNGVNQTLDQTTTDVNFGYSDAFSVEFWIYPLSRFGVTYVSNLDSSPINGWRIRAAGSGANRGGIIFQIADNGSSNYAIVTNSSNLITEDAWNHVIVSKPANNVASNCRIYVNGNSVAFTVNQTGGTGTPTFLDKLTIGDNSDGSSSAKLHGYLNQCLIYNRDLSAAEATSHYNGGIAQDRVNDSGLIRYFLFENDLTDELGNQDLTGYNSPTFTRLRP